MRPSSSRSFFDGIAPRLPRRLVRAMGAALICILAAGSCPALFPAEATAATTLQPQANSRVLGASYFSVASGAISTLMLNNKGPADLSVNITVFNLTGGHIDVPPVVVASDSFKSVDFSTLGLPPTFQEGHVTVSYQGAEFLLGAQMRVYSAAYSLMFDEQFVDLQLMFASNRLEGVWWLPTTGTQCRLVLTNTTSGTVSVTTVTKNGSAAPDSSVRTLNPHETKVIDVQQVLLGGGAIASSGGISVTHSSTPGAVLARTLVSKAQVGYSASMEFSDPVSAKTTSRNGAGVRFRSVAAQVLSSTLVLRNVGLTTVVVSGSIPYTTVSGTSSSIAFGPFTIAPGNLHSVSSSTFLTPQQADAVAAAGIEFSWNGLPGDVVAALQTVSADFTHSFRVPILDTGFLPSSTGGYPWYIANGSSTTIYLKNTSGSAQELSMQLDYGSASSSVYVFGVITLQPHETKAFDVQKLRDDGTPDSLGSSLPIDASSGQLFWSQFDTTTVSIVGRSEQTNTAAGVSSTYACLDCCPHSTAGGNIKGPAEGGPGVVKFKALQPTGSCYGLPFVPFPLPPNRVTWSSNNPNLVFPDNHAGTAIAASVPVPISITVTAQWTASTWVHQEPPCGERTEGEGEPPVTSCCQRLVEPVSVSTVFMLNPLVLSVSEITPSRWPVFGGGVNTTILGSGFGTDGTEVTLSIDGMGLEIEEHPVFNIQDKKLEAAIEITDAAMAAGKHTVTVTRLGESATVDIYFQVPSKLVRQSITEPVVLGPPSYGPIPSSDPSKPPQVASACGSYRFVTYTVMDQDTPAKEINWSVFRYGGTFRIEEVFAPGDACTPQGGEFDFGHTVLYDTIALFLPNPPPCPTPGGSTPTTCTQTFVFRTGTSYSVPLTTKNRITQHLNADGTYILDVQNLVP